MLTKIIFIISFLFTHHCKAETLSTSDFEAIKRYLSEADNRTLVIFDVNEVLLQPIDQILQAQNRPYRKVLERQLNHYSSKYDIKHYESIIWLNGKVEPVDDRFIVLIQDLQQRGVKVLALTNCFTGSHGRIKDMQVWREQELMKLSYDFRQSWPALLPITLDRLNDDGRTIAYKDGIVYTSDMPRGSALKAFLKHLNWQPNKIIFIDDKMVNIKSVEDAMGDFINIDFVGIEYTAVVDREHKPLDQYRANYQFDILNYQYRWLSDAEYNELMSKK